MIDIDNLQSRLDASADAKLKQHINEVFTPIEAMFFHPKPTLFYGQGSQHPLDTSIVIKNLKNIAFAMLQEKWRGDVLTGFLAKVESVGSQVDELRESISE